MRLAIKFLAVFLLVSAGPVALSAQEVEPEVTSGDVNAEGTIIYDKEFFARFPNAVSVADLLTRIPGGQQALGGGGGTSRGFSRNQDNILINGKRLSGKSNDSRSALERITVDQVERIEVIRGSSPDIKVSSQAAIFNIVTSSSNSASGSWQAEGLVLMDGTAQPGGRLSYGGNSGGFEYFVSASRDPLNRSPEQVDRLFDENGIFTRQINEDIKYVRSQTTFNVNLGYTFQNGDQVRLNGQYQKWDLVNNQRGTIFEPDGMGGLFQSGKSLRVEDTKRPGYEIGGDITKRITDNLELKVIGLFSSITETLVQGEDFDIIDEAVLNDFLSINDKVATEKIGRISVSWTPNATHSLEIGTEMASNSLDTTLQFFEREGDQLVEQDVSGGNTLVEEIRNESFFIHTWQINEKSSLETSLFTEWSRISQTGDLNNSRTFFFLRPSMDFRHNLDPQNQFQLSVRRRVGQLDFEDFATTVSQDDEIVGGNPNLVPWKRWEVELGYEHRLKNDKGFFKVRLFYRAIQDAIERVELAPGISGVGNVGNATDYGIMLDASYRFTDIGLRNLVLYAEFRLRRARLTDAFTGERRRPDWAFPNRIKIDIRHDVQSLNFSWGFTVNREAEDTFHDYDEVIIRNAPLYWMELFVERQVIKGVVLRLTWANSANPDAGRIRSFFEDGRATGSLSGTELRKLKWRRRVEITLTGTF